MEKGRRPLTFRRCGLTVGQRLVSGEDNRDAKDFLCLNNSNTEVRAARDFLCPYVSRVGQHSSNCPALTQKRIQMKRIWMSRRWCQWLQPTGTKAHTPLRRRDRDKAVAGHGFKPGGDEAAPPTFHVKKEPLLPRTIFTHQTASAPDMMEERMEPNIHTFKGRMDFKSSI